MKRRISVIVAVLLCLLLLAVLVACNQEKPSEPALTGAEITGTLKDEYVRNEKIDLSGILVTATYEDGTSRTFTVNDTAVSVSGGDTQTSGENFTLTVRFETFEKTFGYSVRDTVLTLILGDGSCNGEKNFTFPTPENYTDLTGYLPVPDNAGMEFAGWFCDAEFRTPATTNFGGKVDTSADITLYAGYDVDYSETFGYEENGNEITLTELLSGALFGTGRLTIPDTVKLRPVTKIGDGFINEFYTSWLVYDELYFGENSAVREIGKSAFAGARSLSSVVFPKTLVRIGTEAFSGCGFSELHFPASLERIDEGAFASNSSLVLIDFGESSRVSEIEMRAFEYCRALPEVTLPSGLSTLGLYVFSGCDMLEKIRIGENLKNIGLYAFQACANLIAFEVDPRNMTYQSIDGNLYSKDGKIFYRYCFGKNEETFTLPEGVTTIFESAFDSLLVNTPLTRIVLPESLTSIEDFAFRSTGATFVIPAGVSKISENAFSRSTLTWFEVAEGNPYFCTKEGVLYSKDMTELVAIPARYGKYEYVLDSRVKRILSGAFNYNETIRDFVIPADSALEVIQERALVLFQAKELCGLYIKKAEPFRLEPSALHNKEVPINTTFVCYISEGNLAAYLTAWGEYETLSGAGVAEYILDADRICEVILARIAEKIGDFTDVDDMVEKLNAFLKDSKNRAEMYSSAMYSDFSEIVKVLNGAYHSGAQLGKISEELIAFEGTMLRFFTEYYYENIGEPIFVRQTDFHILYSHYQLVPATYRGQLTGLDEKMQAVLDETARIIAIQEEIVRKATVVAGDMQNFDAETARWIVENYDRYGLLYISVQWSDHLHIYRTDCSLMIYEFLEAGVSADSLGTLRKLLGSEYAEEPCIMMYLNGFFRSENSRASLYHYEDFIKAHAAMELALPDLVAEINRDVAEFDFDNFNLQQALRAIRNYDELDDSERDLDVWPNYSALRFRSSLLRLNAMEINEENYEIASTLYADVAVFDNEFVREISGATEEELAAFLTKEKQLLAICEKRNAAFIEAVKNAGKNGIPTLAEMEALYEQVQLDTLLGFVTITVEDTDGEPLVLNLMDAYYSIMKNLLIKSFAAKFEEINNDNYYTAYVRIYGGFEDGQYVYGISFYEGLEGEESGMYYERLFLTQSEILHYNGLIEQFNEILFGGM